LRMLFLSRDEKPAKRRNAADGGQGKDPGSGIRVW